MTEGRRWLRIRVRVMTGARRGLAARLGVDQRPGADNSAASIRDRGMAGLLARLRWSERVMLPNSSSPLRAMCRLRDGWS